jgi:hypothetical protein
VKCRRSRSAHTCRRESRFRKSASGHGRLSPGTRRRALKVPTSLTRSPSPSPMPFIGGTGSTLTSNTTCGPSIQRVRPYADERGADRPPLAEPTSNVGPLNRDRHPHRTANGQPCIAAPQPAFDRPPRRRRPRRTKRRMGRRPPLHERRVDRQGARRSGRRARGGDRDRRSRVNVRRG